MGNYLKALGGVSVPLFFQLVRWRLSGAPKTYDELFAWEEQHGFEYTLLRARWHHNYKFSLAMPRSFNEKLVHRRLFSRDPIWPIVTDKVEVRRWLKFAGYSGVVDLPEVQGIYERHEDIPSEIFGGPFVLKCAWASGYNFFLDEGSVREEDVRRQLEKWSNEPYRVTKLVWASHHIPRRYIVEKKLVDVQHPVPPDFKFFVLHGKVEFCQIDLDRFGDHTRLFLDRSGKKMSFSYKTKSSKAEFVFDMDEYTRMVSIAERLGEHFDFIRVDLYAVNGKVLLGELTQTPESGFGVFSPSDWDFELGSRWRYEPGKPSYFASLDKEVID